MTAVSAKVSVTDEDRVDPANIKAWKVTSYSYSTIVLATCVEEAKALGVYWIGLSRGRPTGSQYVRANPASSEDVQRWLDARRQYRTLSGEGL